MRLGHAHSNCRLCQRENKLKLEGASKWVGVSPHKVIALACAKVEACACNAEPTILADILTSLGSRLPALLGRDSNRKTSIPYATAPADGSADMLPSARLDYASARVVCPVENEKSSSSVVRPSSPHISYVYVIKPIGSAPSAAAFLELAPSEYPLRSHHNCIEGYYGRRRTRDIYPSTPIGTAA